MKIAFLFAGQGAQYVSMGKDFYNEYEIVRNIVDKANQFFPIKETCFEGPKELLDNTAYAQPCLFTMSYAISQVLDSYHIHPEYVAGLSLGEYSALAYSEAICFEDGIQIVKERGKIMNEALPPHKTTMAAILAMDASEIEDVLSSIDDVTIANYNCPGQIVMSGSVEGIEKATVALKQAGAKRIIPLSVSGAFHSPYLKEASFLLKKELEKYTFQKPKYKVVYNVSAKEEQQNLIDLLVKQIQSSVYFYQSLEYMIDKGVDTFIEIGPGHTLSSFVKKTNRNVRVYSIDTVEDLKKVLGEL